MQCYGSLDHLEQHSAVPVRSNLELVQELDWRITVYDIAYGGAGGAGSEWRETSHISICSLWLEEI